MDVLEKFIIVTILGIVTSARGESLHGRHEDKADSSDFFIFMGEEFILRADASLSDFEVHEKLIVISV